jgi:hypothetical protein
MNGLILFIEGIDLFDIRKNKIKKEYEEIYKKDQNFYFTEFDIKKIKKYDFDSKEYSIVLRKRGKYYYAFLIKEKNQYYAEYVLMDGNTIYSTKDFNKFNKEVLLPKFGINYFYLDVINEINKKTFLLKF